MTNADLRHPLTALLASVALALAGTVLLAPPAHAATVSAVIDGVTYEADNTNVSAGATAADFDESSASVSIPAVVNLAGTDYAVTTVGSNAFASNGLTAVTIPSSVTTIGDTAFNSNNLTSVNIPDNVTGIGFRAFYNNELTSVSFPASVTTIDADAFAFNALTSVAIPDTITSVGTGAFYGNELTALTIGSGLTALPEGAFSNNLLTGVTIPANVTSIGDNAFGTNQLTEVTVPNTVTSIGGLAFQDNKIASLDLGDGVTAIGFGVFLNNKLTSVTIPAVVTSMGISAFDQNPELASVQFLGSAPTVVAAGANESFDTASGSLVLSYPKPLGEPFTPGGYTTPLWNGYTTAPNSVAITGLVPTITGTVREGRTLTANAGPVAPGSATFTYRWKRDARSIAGATGKTYKLVKNDAGHRITVSITANAPGLDPVSATSAPSALVSSPSKRLVLTTKTVKKGTTFGIVATGLKPGQTYKIWLGGKLAYSGHAYSTGTVARTAAKFPSSIDPGTRRVRVSGYDSQGDRTFTVYTSVTYKK